MLLCAVVGLVLLGSGAWALPRPDAAVQAREPLAGVAEAPVSTVPPAGLTTSPATPAPPAAPPTEPPTGGATSKAPSSTSPSSDAPAPAPAEPVAVPARGPGTYERSHVSVPTTADRGRLYRFDVRVEKGLDLDPDEVARALEKTLDDPRSWRWSDGARFSLVAAGEPADLHAYLVTPGTTDRLCAPLLTRGKVSCQTGDKVVLNARRWVLGSEAFGPDLPAYRQYLANHEFGHALGHHHVGCPASGRPAPVMVQQTKSLQGCTANPWPSVTRG